MKQRIIAVLLVFGCLILGLLGFFLTIGQDKKEPEITVEKREMSYTEGETYDSLLEGVTAKDNRDGDLTDQVFVDRVVPYKEGKAVVYYGVMDKQKNVGTGKRLVDYTALDEEKETDVSAEDADADEEKAEDAEPSESEKDVKDADGDDTESKEKKEDSDTDDAENEEKLKPDGENPAISLVKKKVTIKAGEAFQPLDMVKEVVDDKDDAATLHKYIHVDGKYDTEKKGVYKLTYYVTDSDKHASEKLTLTLTVK